MSNIIIERWIAISLKRGFMEKINLPFFYQLGGQISPLTKLEYDTEKRLDLLIMAVGIPRTISALLEGFPVLNVCREAHTKLSNAIGQAWDWYSKEDNEKRDKKDWSGDEKFRSVIERAKEFEIVLSAELQTLAAYHVTQKGIYSTADLIDEAEKILPGSILPKISEEVKEEIRQSGKCLAFDSGTACAFHIMRAIELVMHEFYITILKPKPKPTRRLPNWGEYINKFQSSSNPSAKELAVLLQQIKDKHRNLVMHPEMTLSVDEAFSLFEIAKGVLIFMADKLPVLKKN